MTTRRRLVGTQTAQWNNPGDRYTGVYYKLEEVPYAGGKIILKYSFETDGSTYIVMGNMKIDEGMAEVKIGETVEITYLGDTPTSGGFTMRLFEVAVIEEGSDNEG